MIGVEGHVTLVRRNIGKHTDEDFKRAREEGWLKQLVDSLDLDNIHGPQKNLINHTFCMWMFPRLFSSSYVGDTWLSDTNYSQCWPWGIALTAWDSEPYVTEYRWSNNWYGDMNTKISEFYGGYNIGNGAFGYFEESQAEADEIKSDPLGREAIYYRERWLFSPSSFSSSNIRSLAFICGQQEGIPSNSGRAGLGGSIRLKDSNGLPIIYTKTTNQIVLVEYKMIYASV